MPTEDRETACALVRRGDSALLLDAGTGVRRLATQPTLIEGATNLDVVLTHFHLDHVCGLSYLPALSTRATVWAPGRWLYGRSSDALLRPLLEPPVSAFERAEFGAVHELVAGAQQIGGFTVTTRAQLRHWAPTAGLRIDDDLALITDTAYDPEAVSLVRGVRHLLHEAWSPSSAPSSATGDATGRDAGRVAAAAGVGLLTLIHLNPLLSDHGAVLDDARVVAPDTRLGEDAQVLD
jgi:ribonuclease BN (tRNA processing enzyme)